MKHAEIKAYCCECGKLTKHQFVLFGRNEEKRTNSGSSFFKRCLGTMLQIVFGRYASYGDYQCTLCGEYLSTPEALL